MASNEDLERRLVALEQQLTTLKEQASVDKMKGIAEDVLSKFTIKTSGKLKVSGSGNNMTMSIEKYNFQGSGVCVDGAITLTITVDD